MKRLLIIGSTVFGVLIIAVLAFIFSTHKKTESVFTSNPAGFNIKYPDFDRDTSTVRYFTGEAFAQYSSGGKKSEALTPQYILPEITDVSWGKNGAFFNASNYSPIDELYGALLQQYPLTDSDTQPTDLNYWWYSDFATGKITLLDTLVSSALKKGTSDHIVSLKSLNDDGLDFIFATTNEDPASSSLFLYKNGKISLLGGKQPKTIDAVTHQGIYYESNNGHIYRMPLGGGSSTELANGYGAQISPDGQSLAYLRNKSNEGPISLYLMRLNSGKEELVSGVMSGTYSLDNNNLLYLPDAQKPIFERVNNFTHKHSLYNATDLDNTTIIKGIVAINLDDGSFFALTDNNALIQFGSQAANATAVNNMEFKIRDDLYLDGFSINYLPDDNIYRVEITKAPYATYQQKAIEYITQQGIDPLQIPIRWYASDRIPVPPSHASGRP